MTTAAAPGNLIKQSWSLGLGQIRTPKVCSEKSIIITDQTVWISANLCLLRVSCENPCSVFQEVNSCGGVLWPSSGKQLITDIDRHVFKAFPYFPMQCTTRRCCMEWKCNEWIYLVWLIHRSDFN